MAAADLFISIAQALGDLAVGAVGDRLSRRPLWQRVLLTALMLAAIFIVAGLLLLLGAFGFGFVEAARG